MTATRWTLLLIGLAAAGGCGGRPPPAPDALPDEVVRARTTRRFGAMAQLMPENLVEGDALSDLAPLILVEGRLAGTFGVVGPGEDGAAIVPGRPTVYTARQTSVIRGVEHPQVVYHWWFRAEGDRDFWSQGVRITVGPDGHPVCWEVQRDGTGLAVLYVSASLEAAAAKRHGATLAGRAFAVERARAVTPDVVVARVLVDGPVPMGPWVYLLTGAGDVQTVICRCMESQTSGPLDRTGYRLEPWPDRSGLPTPFPPDGPALPARQRLEERLRWP